MAQAFPPGTLSLPRRHARMLTALGVALERGARVLDFGCGDGASVYAYRDEGVDAYGFEIVASVRLRDPEDAKFFKFSLTGVSALTPDYRLDAKDYKIPFESSSFDFVFSNHVFEHVTDYDAAFQEVARVLKPGGTSINVFPARYRLIEPHIKVPLAGFVRWRPWYVLWALLGVRNDFQRRLGRLARARENVGFMKTGVNYLTTAKILTHAMRHFREADLVPHLWHLANDGYNRRGALCAVSPLFRALYAKLGTVVLFVKK